MKKRISLLVVANNCPWPSWWSQIYALKNWFNAEIDLEVTLRHTSFFNVPFELYNAEAGWYGVSRLWYDLNVSPLGAGHDIVLFVMSTADWKGVKARGWRTDKDQGPVELQIAADEKEHIYLHGEDLGTAFFQYGRHEMMHALFMLSGQPDTTHSWWDRGIDKFDGVLEDLSFPEPHVADKPDILSIAFAWLSSVIPWLKGPRTTPMPPLPPELIVPPNTKPRASLDAFCKAIEVFEGYYPPGPAYPIGSRSWRNKNPGNLRYVGQIGATPDKQNFCIFKTYDDGFAALKGMVQRAIEGKSKWYKPSMTFTQFFEVYAPGYDSNDPNRYAHFVAEKCGVPVDTRISELSLG